MTLRKEWHLCKILQALKGGACPKLTILSLSEVCRSPVEILAELLEARKANSSCADITTLGNNWDENADRADVLRIWRTCLPTYLPYIKQCKRSSACGYSSMHDKNDVGPLALKTSRYGSRGDPVKMASIASSMAAIEALCKSAPLLEEPFLQQIALSGAATRHR